MPLLMVTPLAPEVSLPQTSAPVELVVNFPPPVRPEQSIVLMVIPPDDIDSPPLKVEVAPDSKVMFPPVIVSPP